MVDLSGVLRRWCPRYARASVLSPGRKEAMTEETITTKDALRDALSAISVQKVALIQSRDEMSRQIERLIDAEVKALWAMREAT